MAAMPARAGTAVVIWPVDPVIEADETATALWLENRGTQKVVLQLRAFGWSQETGEDAHVRQDDVAMSPPLAEIAPGERQLVRLIKRRPPAGGTERAFRLLIDELPPAIDAGQASGPVAGLAIQMRYSIPLFVEGAGMTPKAVPHLTATIIVEGGRRYARIVNGGTRHARLSDLAITHNGRRTMISAGLAGYVLPGATMRWALPDDVPPGGTLSVAVNGVEQTIAVGA